ncbi:hypothetical protein M9M90_01165 [Phenylobacterium sp. LH3H17]|uniref:hypothetical protein n=1 Tax=Phenylobacterium sp. LH3H17 TaxID=2903901 RepID=UPI0020C9A68F|nr:hypothetical protein [Phenylobacterium sp. LH3H17]UTP39814.1 hypothetical protein M9M90_01165 [Phenylobacterium sp. LH3H17]
MAKVGSCQAVLAFGMTPQAEPSNFWEAFSAVATAGAAVVALGIAVASYLIDTHRRWEAARSTLRLAESVAKDATDFFQTMQDRGSFTSHFCKITRTSGSFQAVLLNMQELRLVDLPTERAVAAFSRVRALVMDFDGSLALLAGVPGSASRINAKPHLSGCGVAALNLTLEVEAFAHPLAFRWPRLWKRRKRLEA